MSDVKKYSEYSFEIKWSPEDGCYIARCSELPGLSAFGDTRVEALKQGETALKLFIEDYEEMDDELPEPEVIDY